MTFPTALTNRFILPAYGSGVKGTANTQSHFQTIFADWLANAENL
jgi:hypothetical protein